MFKIYVLTDGSYDDWHMVDIITGPSKPALSTLLKQFCAEYDVPTRKELFGKLGYVKETYNLFFAKQEKAEEKIKKDLALSDERGYTLGKLFVLWLIKYHKFIIDKSVKTIHLGFD